MTLAKTTSRGASDSKTRVQLDLAPAQVARLIWLQEVCGSETRKDLFNVALSILEWSVKEVMDGKTIASVDKDAKHFKELYAPALADAASYAVHHEKVDPSKLSVVA